MQEFISEDDLKTFEGWLKYQAVDAAATAPEELARWRGLFEDARARTATSPKVGLMKLQPVPGEHRYAVAVREGSDLWLTLWVRRSRKGEFFIMLPRGDRDWDQHTSYHLDGTLHMKRYDREVLEPQRRQPLTGTFRGGEHLGAYFGHGPKSVGAICDPKAFSGVVEIAPGVLGPRDGGVTVDLVEPRSGPTASPWTQIVSRQVFRGLNSMMWRARSTSFVGHSTDPPCANIARPKNEVERGGKMIPARAMHLDRHCFSNAPVTTIVASTPGAC